MDNKREAIEMINNLSDIKMTYIMHILRNVSKSSDQEVKSRMHSVQKFEELTGLIHTLPNPWESEEELFAEMSEDRRKKRAMIRDYNLDEI